MIITISIIIKSIMQTEVFKQHNDFSARGCNKFKITILVIFVIVGVTFCSNILFGVSHIQINVTASSI